ncbi:hypothetical protein Aut01nite_03190 [Actinoplanes utahensis]|nr:hypothetical protein Aut01nite_03190 [Actinoplanes utahensis]
MADGPGQAARPPESGLVTGVPGVRRADRAAAGIPPPSPPEGREAALSGSTPDTWRQDVIVGDEALLDRCTDASLAGRR